MLGGTTKGFCLREWELWYGDHPASLTGGEIPCPLPLSDKQLCGATSIDNSPRCPYANKSLNVDFEACKLTTYGKSPQSTIGNWWRWAGKHTTLRSFDV